MLRLAVLEDAYRTLLHGVSRAKYLEGAHEEALAWVRGDYRCHSGFSLSDICELFGLDTKYVRKKLLSIEPLDAGQQVHLTSHRNTSHRVQQQGYPSERMARHRVDRPHKIKAGRKRDRLSQ
jgi:hypothetical protein